MKTYFVHYFVSGDSSDEDDSESLIDTTTLRFEAKDLNSLLEELNSGDDRIQPELKTVAVYGDIEIGYYLIYDSKNKVVYRDDDVLGNSEFIATTLINDPSILEYVDDSLKKDKDIVLEAVKQDSSALEYANESLKKDPDILAIINNDE